MTTDVIHVHARIAQAEREGIDAGLAISFEAALKRWGSSRAAVEAGCIPMQEHAGFWLTLKGTDPAGWPLRDGPQ